MKKITVVLVVLLLSTASAFAFVYSPFISAEASGVFCFPTADYLNKQSEALFRTSGSFVFDLYPYGSSGEHFRASVGASAMYVSMSIVTNNNYALKPYLGIGPSVRTDYRFASGFGIGMAAKLLYCEFFPMNDWFLTLEASIIPSKRLSQQNAFHLDLDFPATVSVKKDTISARLGVALNIGFDISSKKGGK